MQIHKEFREFLLQKIPRNFTEFRGIPFIFQKIPYSVGSQKRTSVDTLPGSDFVFDNLLHIAVRRGQIRNPR